MVKAPAIPEIVSSFVNLDYRQAGELIKKMLDSGVPANNILASMQDGMVEVGKKYEEGEYFLSELMAAGEMFKAAMEELEPHLITKNVTRRGTIVLGTVQGDLHDIGKNIFKTLLQSAGFDVRDLGVDIPPEKFVDEVKNSGGQIVAMSCLLTTSMDQMRIVIRELEKAGERNKIRVIIGGNAVTEEFAREIGADYAAKDAVLGLRQCKQWMEGK